MQSTLSIPRLRSTLSGRVITPGDAPYDHARAVFYGGFDYRPAAVVRVADAADIALVVNLARETGADHRRPRSRQKQSSSRAPDRCQSRSLVAGCR